MKGTLAIYLTHLMTFEPCANYTVQSTSPNLGLSILSGANLKVVDRDTFNQSHRSCRQKCGLARPDAWLLNI